MESITKYIQLRKTDKDYSIKLPSTLMMVSKATTCLDQIIVTHRDTDWCSSWWDPKCSYIDVEIWRARRQHLGGRIDCKNSQPTTLESCVDYVERNRICMTSHLIQCLTVISKHLNIASLLLFQLFRSTSLDFYSYSISTGFNYSYFLYIPFIKSNFHWDSFSQSTATL